jgi:hypothetical protein
VWKVGIRREKVEVKQKGKGKVWENVEKTRDLKREAGIG